MNYTKTFTSWLVSTPKKTRLTRLEKVLVGLVAGGGVIATLAVMWPSQEDLQIHASSPARATRMNTATQVAPAMQVATVVAPAAPVNTVDAGTTEVAGKRPLIAVQDDEPVAEDEIEEPGDGPTDYESVALKDLDRGDVESAFTNLRKHLYRHEPTAEVLLQIGRLGRQLKELAVAEQALLDAGALDPSDAEIPVELGRIYLDSGALQDARWQARQAIRLDKNNTAAWNLAGRVAMAESEWQRAEQAFRQAAGLVPTDAMVHNNLGLLYIHMGRGAAAVDSLETSVALFDAEVPDFVYNNLGLAYELNKQIEDAREAYHLALAANPDYAKARVNMERVNKMEVTQTQTQTQTATKATDADDVPTDDDGDFEFEDS